MGMGLNREKGISKREGRILPLSVLRAVAKGGEK
jgi:hypothetical protein